MKVALVHNPNAGNGVISADELHDRLRVQGYEPLAVPPDAHPGAFASRHGAEFVVVAGGDGTLRRTALALEGSGIPVAPLPLGTANNIGRSLGISGNPSDIIRRWVPGQVRPVDVGIARGPWGARPFLEGMGLGLIGRGISIIEEIDEATTRTFDDPEDKLHRDLSVFIALVHELSPVRLSLSIDGREEEAEFLLLEIMNIQHAGPRIQLTAGGDPSDGFLDVVVAKARDRERLLHSLRSSLAGRRPDPILHAIKARSVEVTWRGGDVRLDDELLHTTADGPNVRPEIPFSVTIAPGALRVIAPAAADT